MHRIFRVKAYEAEHGPHFNEEHARKAVSKMENEDGTRGPHWSIEETTTLANQYGICPKLWRQLPCQGLFILHVTSTPASAATPTDLVFIDPTSFTNRQIDNTTTVITSTGAKALLNGSGTQMTNNEITTGNRYLIYYNKCDGIFQVINHIVTPTTPAT